MRDAGPVHNNHSGTDQRAESELCVRSGVFHHNCNCNYHVITNRICRVEMHDVLFSLICISSYSPGARPLKMSRNELDLEKVRGDRIQSNAAKNWFEFLCTFQMQKNIKQRH